MALLGGLRRRKKRPTGGRACNREFTEAALRRPAVGRVERTRETRMTVGPALFPFSPVDAWLHDAVAGRLPRLRPLMVADELEPDDLRNPGAPGAAGCDDGVFPLRP